MKEWMTTLKFKYACYKLKRKHGKVVKCRLKGLKICLSVINKIGIPVSEEEKEVLGEALTFYDKMLEELMHDVDRGRQYYDEFCMEV